MGADDALAAVMAVAADNSAASNGTAGAGSAAPQPFALQQSLLPGAAGEALLHGGGSAADNYLQAVNALQAALDLAQQAGDLPAVRAAALALTQAQGPLRPLPAALALCTAQGAASAAGLRTLLCDAAAPGQLERLLLLQRERMRNQLVQPEAAPEHQEVCGQLNAGVCACQPTCSSSASASMTLCSSPGMAVEYARCAAGLVRVLPAMRIVTGRNRNASKCAAAGTSLICSIECPCAGQNSALLHCKGFKTCRTWRVSASLFTCD
jgi:hypothetical protein